MKKILTIGYQNRTSRGYGGSGVGSLSRDLPTAEKLVLANHFLKNISGFTIGEKVLVEYSPDLITISKLTKTL